MLEVADHVAALRVDGELMAAAAGRAGPDAAVPSCPEWVVRDLVRHMGEVHRWATGYLANGWTQYEPPGGYQEPEWPADADLVDWLLDGHKALVEVLEAADPDLECWTFLAAPSSLAMWARRQAHETAVHRVDAELATGDPTPFAPAFAVDGVDELLTCFITRPRFALRAEKPTTLAVAPTDVGVEWLVHIGPDPVRTERRSPGSAPADCRVSGPTSTLYLMLWNRVTLDGLEVDGDGEVLTLFREGVTIRWS